MKIPEGQRHVYDYFVDEHGQWFCEGNPVIDNEVFRLLSRSLFEEDGKYYVRCEGEVHPVRVADAPLWVRYIHPGFSSHGELESVEIELTDGRREKLHPNTLILEGDSALYCLATRKNLKARFGKTAYYEIARYIDWNEQTQRFVITVGGKKYTIR